MEDPDADSGPGCSYNNGNHLFARRVSVRSTATDKRTWFSYTWPSDATIGLRLHILFLIDTSDITWGNHFEGAKSVKGIASR